MPNLQIYLFAFLSIVSVVHLPSVMGAKISLPIIAPLLLRSISLKVSTISTQTYLAYTQELTTTTTATALTKTEVYVNITQIYDNVGAGDMQNSLVSQSVARNVLSMCIGVIPARDIRIPKLYSHTLKQTAVVFEVLGRLEELGFNNTASYAFTTWLQKNISSCISSGSYTAALKAEGQAAGINVFSKAKVISQPTYATPRIVYAETYTPSSVPSGLPTAEPTWGKCQGGAWTATGCICVLYYVIVFHVFCHCACSEWYTYNMSVCGDVG